MNKLRRCMMIMLAFLMLTQPAAAGSQAVLTEADAVRQTPNGSHPSAVIPQGARRVADSDELSLWLDMDGGLCYIQDKRNGYVFATGRRDERTRTLSAKWAGYAACYLSGDFVTLANMNTFSETPDPESMMFAVREDGVDITLYFLKSGFSCVLRLTLEGDALVVDIPDRLMTSGAGECRLLKLSVMPFMGASFQGEGDGYILMPDGCGALIRFDAPLAARTLTMRVFGEDGNLTAIGSLLSALGETPAKPMEQALVPLMGIAHGGKQNAFALWIEKGAPYCQMVASPAGCNNLPCYFGYVQAVYNELYLQPVSDAESFPMVQSQQNPVDLSLRYTFLSGERADWVGIAQAYRQYLEAGHALPDCRQPAAMPLMLDCLMGESVKSLLDTAHVAMTALADVVRWQEILHDHDVKPLVMVLEGMTDGGVSRQRYDQFAVNGDTAALSGLTEAADGAAAILVRRQLLKFYEKQLPVSARAYGVTHRFIQTDEADYLDDKAYYLRLDRLGELADGWARNLAGQGFAADDAGRLLYANQSPAAFTRDAAVREIQTALATLKNRGSVALSSPNAYAWPYADYVYDLPASHSALTFETDAVPMLQMILSGSALTFGKNSVPGASSDTQLLRMIDFGLYPHYTLTQKSSALLEKSNSNRLFATEADALLDKAIEEYRYLSAYLAPVAGQAMTGRNSPMDGVSVTDYANGYRVAVNYNREPCQVGTITIPGLSARVWKEDRP